MIKSNKKLLSLVVVAMYAVCTLVAAPVQAYAATSGTHVTAKYTYAQKAAQTKKALLALSKLPKSTTSAKAYDKSSEYVLLQKLYKTANDEVNKAKNMGLNYKKFLNYGRLAISKSRIAWLKAYFAPVIVTGTIVDIVRDGDFNDVDSTDDGTIFFVQVGANLFSFYSVGPADFGVLSIKTDGKSITTEVELEGTVAAIEPGDTIRITFPDKTPNPLKDTIEIRY